MFNALCASFEEPPEMCLKTLHREPQASAQTFFDMTEEEEMITAGEIVCVVFGLILLNILVVYCCRRRARRDMQNAMNMQIES